MKKYIFSAIFLMTCTSIYAQYNPTQKDIGKDCSTESGKLGTWKSVTVTENISNTTTSSKNESNSNSRSINGNAEISTGVGAGKISAGVSGGYSTSNSNGTNKSTSTNNSTTITYNDIRCVEDKNANLPQQTPVRW